MFQEVVEAQGHLIDSHLMERIFDTVVEYHGKFEVETFSVGKTNAEPSRLRMKVGTAEAGDMEQMLSNLIALGCTPVDAGDATLETVEKDRCAPLDFYSTTNHRTQVRLGGEWVDVANQRMDAMIVVKGGGAVCRRLRDLKPGDQVVTGMRGIRVLPESKERDSGSAYNSCQWRRIAFRIGPRAEPTQRLSVCCSSFRRNAAFTSTAVAAFAGYRRLTPPSSLSPSSPESRFFLPPWL